MIITKNKRKPYLRSKVIGSQAKKWRNKKGGGRLNSNWITVHCDASYSFQTNVGSYAFRIKSNHLTYKGGGLITVSEENKKHGPGYCELMAVLNTVNIAILKHRLIPNIRGINVITDSSTAIQWLKYGSKLNSVKSYVRVRNELHSNISNNNMFIRFIKIEAHADKDIKLKNKGWKSKWCNKLCDEEAKRIRERAEKNMALD